MSPRPFGRRGEPLRQLSPVMASAGAVTPVTVAPAASSLRQDGSLSKELEFSSLDDELEQWKRSRQHKFEIPWRPLSLMASLFFGVASFALPDSVNHVVRWPLYALAAMSFLAGSRRRQQAKT